MKKTININLSGYVFTLDEDAFEMLDQYLNELKKCFRRNPDGDEILQDIEMRIAEILIQKRGTKKQVFSMDDVESIIETLGKPADFNESVEDSDSGEKKTEAQNEPTSKPHPRERKRIFRDPDGKLIGGVCSGLSYYFGVEVLWIRLFLALIFLVMGSGLILYLLLWAIIPQAESTSEKLEMKGEPVNVDNIRKSVEDEMEGVKSKFNEFQKKNNLEDRIRTFFSLIIEFISKIVGWIFKGLQKVLGATFIFISIVLLFFFGVIIFGDAHSFNVSLPTASDFPEGISEFLHWFLEHPNQYEFVLLLAFAVFFLPIMLMMMWGLKSLFNIDQGIRKYAIPFVIIWIISLFSLVLFTAYISMDYLKYLETVV